MHQGRTCDIIPFAAQRTMGETIKTYLGIASVVLGLGFFNSIGSSHTQVQGVQATPASVIATNTPTPTIIPTLVPTATVIPTVVPTSTPAPYVAPTTVQTFTQPAAVNTSNNKTYINSAGNEIQSPSYSDSVPAGASAICGDGTYSFSQSRRGTCSHHGGVASWL